MEPPGDLLVPTDLGESAEPVALYAAALARRAGAGVRLLHVFDVVELYLPGPASDPDAGATAAPGRRSRGVSARGRALDALAARLRARGAEVTPWTVHEPAPGEAILAALKEGAHALVVMGTQGRSGVGRFLLGSVAEEVVRRADVPVVTVRTGVTPEAAPQRVLVGVDLAAEGPGSPAEWLARAAAVWAARFGGEGATLDLLYVREPLPYPLGPYGPALVELFPGALERTEAALRALAAEAEAAAPGLTVGTGVLEGHPARVLVAEAERRGAGLVVVATHGLEGLDRLLLGSVAERVIRTAPCPVLTFRPPDGGPA